jgi:arabinofuranosyltransferase
VLLAVGAVVAHGAYYVLRVGGDHFEFRIYQHAIPLLFALALWLVTRTRARVLTAGLILGLLVEATWLIPWPDYIQTMHLRRNSDIGKLHRPMADKLPIVFYPWAWKHDDLEAWCVKHLLATPYQTHKWFRLNYQRAQPPRSEALAKLDDFAWHPRNRTKKAYPITSYRSVGVTGWALPNVAILDEYGLNDLVIARNMPREGRFRYSAHDRFPPPGYLDCFRPNVRIEDKLLKFTKRDPPMKPADIKDCEDRFLLQVTEGVPALTEAELEAWHAEKAAEREAEKARKAAKQAADSPVEADAPDDEAGDPEE